MSVTSSFTLETGFMLSLLSQILQGFGSTFLSVGVPQDSARSEPSAVSVTGNFKSAPKWRPVSLNENLIVYTGGKNRSLATLSFNLGNNLVLVTEY